MTDLTDKLRKDFEAAMRVKYPDFPLSRMQGRFPADAGDYVSAGTYHMWNGCQILADRIDELERQNAEMAQALYFARGEAQCAAAKLAEYLKQADQGAES